MYQTDALIEFLKRMQKALHSMEFLFEIISRRAQLFIEQNAFALRYFRNAALPNKQELHLDSEPI